MLKESKISFLFILLPFIDLFTALITRNISFSITPGIIFKSLLLLYFIYYILKSRSKFKKISVGFLVLITIYMFTYFLTKNDLLDFNYILMEFTFLFKLIYFPICFIVLLCFFDDNNISKSTILKIFKFSLIIYVVLLIIPSIFGISYTTYPMHLKGYIGLFYAGNEIANIMIILFPFAYLFIKKSKYSFLILFPIILIIMLIGTKVATFGCLIITLISFIFSIIKNKFRINNVVIKCFLVFAFSIFLTINSYAVYNYKYMKNNYYNDDKNNIIIDDNNKAEVEEIQGMLNIFYQKNKMTKIIRPLVSGRDMLLANTINLLFSSMQKN